MTSYLKILPLFMMVMPGMISRILFPGKRRRRDLFPLFITTGCACSMEPEQPLPNKLKGCNASNAECMTKLSSSYKLENAHPPTADPRHVLHNALLRVLEQLAVILSHNSCAHLF